MKYNYLADFKEGIPYRKSLRKYAGSVTATILIQQLDFRFTNYPDGLYKFLSPVPDHPDYREGDSWTEELGFSEKEFRCAFDHIGVRHSSKTAYMQSVNPFIDESGEEKFYCSYHDKQKGLTWYFRNHEKVDALIEELIKLLPPRQGKRPSSLDSPVTAQRSVTVNDHQEPCNLSKVSYVTDQKESTFIYKKNTENTNKKEEEDSPTPQAIAVVVETLQEKSALEQIEILPNNSENLELNPDTAKVDGVLKQNPINCSTPENVNLISQLTEIDSFLELVLPANENNTQSQPLILPVPLSEQEREALKQAQVYAFNPAIAPWRDAATIVSSKVQRAIFDANPGWYSTGNGSVNIKKINDRIKSLERQMRGTGTQAVEAYVELMNYVTMSQIPNSAEIIKQASGEAKQQATANNLMSMLSDRLSQRNQP